MHKVSLLKLLEDDPLLKIHMSRKPVSLHTVGELTCSSGDIGTSKNFTVEDYFRQGVAGLSALHTQRDMSLIIQDSLRGNKYLTIVKQNNERTSSSTPTKISLESLVSVLETDGFMRKGLHVKSLDTSVGFELGKLNSACHLGYFPEKVK